MLIIVTDFLCINSFVIESSQLDPAWFLSLNIFEQVFEFEETCK